MKLKHIPDDFVVVEDADCEPGADGPFAAYRLTKTGCGTPEALSRAARLLAVPRGGLGYAGLKDNFARTEQWITAEGGPPADVGDAKVRCAYAGQVAEPIGRAQLRSNHFAITLRDCTEAEAAAVVAGMARVTEHGVPNYFDVQRFGSARATGEFPGKHIVTGDPERAVRLLIATPGPDDHGRLRETREACARGWGDWAALAEALPKGPELNVVRHLASHPADFAGAFERWPRDLRQLVLTAWQSFLWNRIVAAWISRRLGPRARPFQTGWQRLVGWDALSPELAAELDGLEVALPRHDAGYEGEWRELAADVLGSEGTTVEGLIARKLKHSHLHHGQRAVRLRPIDPSVDEPVDDAHHPDRLAVTLRFALPPGSYATLVVRCLGVDAKSRRGGTPVGPRRER